MDNYDHFIDRIDTHLAGWFSKLLFWHMRFDDVETAVILEIGDKVEVYDLPPPPWDSLGRGIPERFVFRTVNAPLVVHALGKYVNTDSIYPAFIARFFLSRAVERILRHFD